MTEPTTIKFVATTPQPEQILAALVLAAEKADDTAVYFMLRTICTGLGITSNEVDFMLTDARSAISWHEVAEGKSDFDRVFFDHYNSESRKVGNHTEFAATETDSWEAALRETAQLAISKSIEAGSWPA